MERNNLRSSYITVERLEDSNKVKIIFRAGGRDKVVYLRPSILEYLPQMLSKVSEEDWACQRMIEIFEEDIFSK